MVNPLWLIAAILSCFGSLHNFVIIGATGKGLSIIIAVSVDIELIGLFVSINVIVIIIQKLFLVAAAMCTHKQ